jgi:hypothetical protein
MDKKLKGKPGESRRRKATELPRYSQRNVSGAARFDGWDFPVCSDPKKGTFNGPPGRGQH